MQHQLSDSIQTLRGIGKTRSERLNQLGIETIGQLLCCLPRTYLDLTRIQMVEQMRVEQPWFGKLTIQSSPTLQYIRSGFSVVRVKAGDETGAITLCWYNQPYMKNNLQVGDAYYVYGKPKYQRGTILMITPMLEKESETEGARLLPVYPLTKGLTQKVMRQTMHEAFDACGDLLAMKTPATFLERYGLLPLEIAYQKAHFPRNADEKDMAVKSISFFELLLLKIYLNRTTQRHSDAPILLIGQAAQDAFEQALPFSLTGAQKRAMDQIREKISSGETMQALLQGDVGSGKTIVAFYALYCAAVNGSQGALLAPTEILCDQHYAAAQKFFEPLHIRVGRLKNGMKKAEREQLLQDVQMGKIQILVGTHAIIGECVCFDSLAVAVTDEQHRFGVHQRAQLAQKGKGVHSLVMSATPIPRTLAMLLYGDLDLLVLEERPSGRLPIKTHIVLPQKRDGLVKFLGDTVNQGGQVYYVCPMIEQTDGGKASVTAVAEALKAALPDCHISFLHGKMKPMEKEEIMSAFVQGKIDILVATTVVEVGVDVANANVMVIEDAGQFGLAQLHQLRGRVGRGSRQSYCFLLTDGVGIERLKVFASTNDGFEIARMDLAQRGPGSLLGEWQHGKSDLFFLTYITGEEILAKILDAFDRVMISGEYGEDFPFVLLHRAMQKYREIAKNIALN